MIDWTKPIETVAGRKASLLTRNFWRNGETYCVVQVEDSSTSNSEIFIINPTTGRCIKSGMQIRNVKVRKEGWILVRKGTNLLGDYRVFETEKDAKQAMSFSECLARIVWEE